MGSVSLPTAKALRLEIWSLNQCPNLILQVKNVFTPLPSRLRGSFTENQSVCLLESIVVDYQIHHQG